MRRVSWWSVLALVTVLASRPADAQNVLAPPATGEVPQVHNGNDTGATREQSTTPGVDISGLPGQPSLGALPGAVDPDAYRLGPGDVLMLNMWGNVSREVPLEVGPEGTLLLPGAGTVRVDGLTLRAAQRELGERMRRQLRGVSVDIRLWRPRVFRVYLTGEVLKPGPIDANGVSRLADVLASTQLEENASRRNIEVRHRDGTREIADLELFLRSGDPRLNPWLRDGDVLYVPHATEFIHVEGAVARPGRFELGRTDSLITLLALADDPLPAADAARVLMVRWPEPFRAESVWTTLDEIYSRALNPALRDGDRLYVYFIPRYQLQHEVVVLGEVARPGTYPIVEGRHHLSDLVTSAGGFLPAADLSAVRVHRRSTSSGERDPELDRLLRLSRSDLTATEYEVMRTKLASQREDYRIDWKRLTRDKADLDLLLRDGDIVRVERLVSSIRIDGEVRNPGIVAYLPGTGIGDYVRQAGGFTDRAWVGKVRITRAVTGQTLLARNVRELDPGDFVWVPERPDVTVWQQARDVLVALSSVATIIIAIQSVQK